MILWCNNTASWGPDIPVGLAILVSTMAMGSVSFHVYKREQVTDRWRGGGAAARAGQSSNRLSNKVFQQSFWFLMAFYLTWPPYLTLQFSWASDNDFTRYGLILSAGILVPMQGFWHFFVYTRPRHFERINTYIWRSSSVFLGVSFHRKQNQPKRGRLTVRTRMKDQTSMLLLSLVAALALQRLAMTRLRILQNLPTESSRVGFDTI